MKRRVLLLCFQNQRTVQQVQTCTVGYDLELQNSNYMDLNAPLFYTARILFLKPTWVHKTGGNVHTLYTCIKRQGSTTPT